MAVGVVASWERFPTVACKLVDQRRHRIVLPLVPLLARRTANLLCPSNGVHTTGADGLHPVIASIVRLVGDNVVHDFTRFPWRLRLLCRLIKTGLLRLSARGAKGRLIRQLLPALRAVHGVLWWRIERQLRDLTAGIVPQPAFTPASCSPDTLLRYLRVAPTGGGRS